MARKRVIPPSTTSSHTTSASPRPAWGRAAGVFSTFTDSAGRRSDLPPGSGRPVRGAAGGGTVLVVVERTGRFRAVGFLSSPHPAATRASTRAVATPNARGLRRPDRRSSTAGRVTSP